MEIGPEHVTLAGLLGAAVGKAAETFARALARKFSKKPRLTAGALIEAQARGELMGEFHEFKRAVLAELEVQRSRYHGLRLIVGTRIAIDEERRASRERGEKFDTGVYEINLRELEAKLDAIPDVELPKLSPPSQRPIPPLGSPVPKPGDDTE
jgi:hypothetical protein